MRDEPQPSEERPVNRRNLVIVLGGIGGLLILANIIDGPSFSFGDSDENGSRETLVIGEDRSAAIDAKAARLEAAIERHVEKSLDAATAKLESAEMHAVDDDELDAAVEDLRGGDPERFLKAIGSP